MFRNWSIHPHIRSFQGLLMGGYVSPKFLHRKALKPLEYLYGSMANVWKPLYAMVWLAFLQIVIVVAPGIPTRLVDLHVLLGLVILGLAHYDNMLLKKVGAPNRVRRIAKAIAILATVQPLLGVMLYVRLRFGIPGFDVPWVQVVTFIHLVIALAIITQASSVATSHDMWSEGEFAAATKPV